MTDDARSGKATAIEPEFRGVDEADRDAQKVWTDEFSHVMGGTDVALLVCQSGSRQ